MPVTRPLPDSPNLDQLKRQAKELLRAARDSDLAQLARFRILPSLQNAGDEELARTSLALHDAQSAIAREHGFPSWNALRERVEELTLGFDDAVRELIEAATDGRTTRAERLLALHPRIATASFHAALLLGDVVTVESFIARNSALARQSGGPRDWEPLHYVCYDSLGHSPIASADGIVAVARRLLELGADPNTRFPWLHHGVRRPVLYGAMSVTQLPALAELLLESGADPNDGVTFTIAASGDNIETLELLLAHGADPNQPWATDGSSTLYAIMQWATTSLGMRWLLEHGAEADPVFAANGETPLHVAARRWDVDMVELLVQHGADISRRRGDGRTAYAIAELNGNRAVADWLRDHGAADELSLADRLVAACGRRDRATAERLLAEHPELRDQLTAEHYMAMHTAAERGDVETLTLLLDCGFDPNRGDEEIGKTALHSAAMAGQPDVVRLLLERGASTGVRDREFHAQPLVWAAEGARSHPDRTRERTEAGLLLLRAGSPIEWQPGEEPGESILEILDDWQRQANGAAGATSTLTARA